MKYMITLFLLISLTKVSWSQSIVHDYLYIQSEYPEVSVRSTAFETRMVELAPKRKDLKDLKSRIIATCMTVVQEYEALGWVLVEVTQQASGPQVWVMRKPKQ